MKHNFKEYCLLSVLYLPFLSFAQPTNGTCANAANLPCETTNQTGTTIGVAQGPADPSICASRYGVWYRFTGDGQSTTISSMASGWDHEMVIYSGSCGSLSGVTCRDVSGTGGAESYTFNATNGTTYFVYIAHYSTSASGSGTNVGAFTISRTCTPPPVLAEPGGSVCDDAAPFCAGSYNFPNTTGVPLGQSGPDYACLGFTGEELEGARNPVWYYMEIETGGTMQLTISQTNSSGGGLDTDFAMWGPFTSPTNACNNIVSGTSVPIQSSFSLASTETVGIGLPGGSNQICNHGNGLTTPPAAIAGQVYVVLITNWSDTPGTINFSQTAGTATTDCGIVLGGDILSFTAKYEVQNRSNILNWVVEHEMNTSHYEVRRSKDGQVWTTIKTLPSKGVFNSDKHYSEKDSEFASDINYYQIWSVDYDGTIKKSDILAIDNTLEAGGKNLVKMVNTLGQEVDESYSGLVIYVYSDGSTIKKYNDKK